MRDTPMLLEGTFPERDPLAGVTVDEVGPGISAALGLQNTIQKETADLLDTCRQWVRQYVIVSNKQALILAAWLLHHGHLKRRRQHRTFTSRHQNGSAVNLA